MKYLVLVDGFASFECEADNRTDAIEQYIDAFGETSAELDAVPDDDQGSW